MLPEKTERLRSMWKAVEPPYPRGYPAHHPEAGEYLAVPEVERLGFYQRILVWDELGEELNVN